MELKLKELQIKNDVRIMEKFLNEFLDYDICDMNEYLQTWHEAKSKYLFKMFGNECIIDCGNVEYFKTDRELERILWDDYDYCKTSYDAKEKLGELAKKVLFYNGDCYGTKLGDRSEIEFLNTRAYYYALLDVLSDSALIKNHTSSSIHHSIKGTFYGTTKSVHVHANQKISKILNTFYEVTEKIFPGEYTEEIRECRKATEKVISLVSGILGQRKTSGHLILSIHPFDYFTMSQNDCGWDSCMALKNGDYRIGDYSAGTSATLNSHSCVIAYLCDDNDFMVTNDGDYWYNKKWRNLFVVDKNFITSINSYPFGQVELDKFILSKLKTMATKNLGWEYGEEIHKRDYNIITNEGEEIILETNKMYNDAECNEGYYYLAVDTSDTPGGYFEYDGEAHCVCCGDIMSNDDEDSQVVCNSCQGLTYCDCCGDLTPIKMMSDFDGEYYCDFCYNERVKNCRGCEDQVFNSRPTITPNTKIEDTKATYVYFAFKNMTYKERDIKEGIFLNLSKGKILKGEFFCAECIKNYLEKGYLKIASYDLGDWCGPEYLYFVTEKGRNNKEFMDNFMDDDTYYSNLLTDTFANKNFEFIEP